MNILLAYNHFTWQKAHYTLEDFFDKAQHTIISFPFEKTAFWTNYYGKLPIYFPRKIPTSIQSIEEKYNIKFDLVIEVDGAGQHHLTGYKKFSGKKVFWSIDTHLPQKRVFSLYFEEDFDMLFTCHKDFMEYFKKRKCIWLPVACNPAFHRKLNLPKLYDIVFVGNMKTHVDYAQRNRLLDLLSSHFNLHIFEGVYGQEMIRIFNQAKIVFNCSLNRDLNLRVFESLGCGSFLLTDHALNGLTDLFEDGKHLSIYHSDQELLDKAQYYLSHENEREEIAHCGHQEILAKHTYFHRIQTLLSSLDGA